MAKKYIPENVKELHKKLMPANIVLAVVALVAAICIMFMPWLDMRISIDGAGVAEVLTESVGDEEDETTQAVIKEMANELKNVELELSLNMKPMKMLSFATKKSTLEERTYVMAEFIVSMMGKDGLTAFLRDLVDDLAPVLLKATANIAIETAINDALKEAGKELTPEQQQQVEVYKEDVGGIIDGLVGEHKNVEKAKEDFNDLVNKIAHEQGGADVEIPEEDINKVFDELVTQGTNPDTNEFDLLYLMSNFDTSKFEDLFGDGEDEDPPAVPSSVNMEKGSAVVLASSSSAPDDEDEGSNTLAEITQFIDNPEEFFAEVLAEGLDEETMDIMQPVVLGLFILVAGLPAFVWLLLAVKATIRIFTEKKKVGMFGAKFFAFWATLFIVMFNVASANLATVLAGAGIVEGVALKVIESISVTFLGSGVVQAICYAILVLGGWFYYGRIKRQIRREMKAYKKSRAYGSVPVSAGANTKEVR